MSGRIVNIPPQWDDDGEVLLRVGRQSRKLPKSNPRVNPPRSLTKPDMNGKKHPIGWSRYQGCGCWVTDLTARQLRDVKERGYTKQ
jgi:hypothetical protein